MWAVNGQRLKMTEGDFGIALPVTISGITFSAADRVKITIKSEANGTVVLEKTFTEITDNTVNLVFTEQESAKLTVGQYVYALDWYLLENFMCNIIPSALFEVVDKA